MITNSFSRDELEEIIKKYGDSVYRLAFMNVKKRELADDIYQDVFLKLIKKKERIDSEEHLKAWLLRTTINCCKDYWKSRWFKSVLYEDKDLDAFDEEKKTGYVTECVQKLPEKYRNVIHLYYYEGYSIKEISEMLGRSENTISSQLARGRKKLEGILSKKEVVL